MLEEECKSCSKGCKDCSSNKTCKTCDIGFYARHDITNNIVCQPCTKGCKKCSSAAECLECDTGYFKNGKVCSECLNSCKTCKWPLVCDLCLQDFRLNDTNCQSCPTGYFLSNSACLPCQDKCAACSSPNECTECKSGLYGNLCHQKCSSGCKDDICDMNIGNCSCKETHVGHYCNKCVPGKFGHNCEFDCPEGCLTCDLNGSCIICNTGYFGLNCHCEQCADGMYGSKCEFHECPSNCFNASCNAESGLCDNGCNKGYWGKYCEKLCAHNCLNNTCFKENGTCSHGCVGGYHGYMCDCPNNCICSGSVSPDGFSSSLLQPIHIGLLIVSLVILILVAVIMGIFLITSYITKQKNLVTGSLGDSITYRQVRRSQDILPSEHNNENNRRQQDAQRIVYQNLADIGNAAINVCEPIQESVYVNVAEYASIQRKQVPDIVEETEDNTNEVVEVKESNLPDGLIKPFHESQKAENVMKNRYKDVCPYDNRRVILKNRESDYINASYIDGYKRQKVYIASLGPTVKQMGADFGVFWNMVWQERVCKIVMLTNLIEQGVQKCDKYWPDKDVCIMYEDVKVTCQSEEIYPCFAVRIFSVEKTEKRILYQMHFTAWPDKSTPRDVHGMIEFWEKLTRIPRFELGPILVHCSAGVGRTGTFLALDILANEGVAEGTVDIFACVRNLREDRVNLVQTVEQYKFLHEALLHLLSSDTSVKALLTSDGAVQHNFQERKLDVDDIHEMV
ncbi:multiple epidermal growth factor-like domains protein 10 [Ruditapes philippinarum]|uniref:multiple epidermal growth factor-like domains protein 10 n=1 Tax=Ruditapes philippinarum TaxID=129788 RepID=UPI00295C0943|nr:multiple epidermal growth factor-like domains protein 10 [Ruditapes philippinarum]